VPPNAYHKHQWAQVGLAAHPRVHLHVTPAHAPGSNLVEVSFRGSGGDDGWAANGHSWESSDGVTAALGS
jgi:hypothetical protein